MNDQLTAQPERKGTIQDAETIRAMIRHEDDQANRRITWFCTVQGLLFTAMAFAWEKQGAKPLVFVFASIGIVVAASAYYGVRAATLAIIRQRTWWDEQMPPNYLGPDVIGRRPDKYSRPWLRPGVVLPWGFAAAWVGVAVVRVVGWA